MTKVSPDDLKAFGLAVKRARSLKTWTLDELGAVINPPVGKSLISKIENGQKEVLNSRTVGRFIKALVMDESWIDKFLSADTTDEGDETKVEQEADRLIRMARKSDSLPQSSEELLILLANKHAEGNYIDRVTAFIGLSKALEAAERMRLRGEMPIDNTGSQLNAVMAEVAKLNAKGKLEEANALLDAEEIRMFDEQRATKERLDEQSRRLLEQRLDQDRLSNDPVAAGERLIRSLIRQAPAGGVFIATSDLGDEWHGRGLKQGDPFDLRVALILAKRNLKRAKGPNKIIGLSDLGKRLHSIGKRRTDIKLLEVSRDILQAAIKTKKKKNQGANNIVVKISLGDVLFEIGSREKNASILRQTISLLSSPINDKAQDMHRLNRAAGQLILAASLQSLGEMEGNPELLLEAIALSEEASGNYRKSEEPDDWAGSRLDIAIIKRSIARLTKDRKLFDEAESLYEEALTVITPTNARYDCANLIGGLGELALDRFALDNNPIYLDEAEKRLLDARRVMLKSNDFLSERCDELLQQITTVRNA